MELSWRAFQAAQASGESLLPFLPECVVQAPRLPERSPSLSESESEGAEVGDGGGSCVPEENESEITCWHLERVYMARLACSAYWEKVECSVVGEWMLEPEDWGRVFDVGLAEEGDVPSLVPKSPLPDLAVLVKLLRNIYRRNNSTRDDDDGDENERAAQALAAFGITVVIPHSIIACGSQPDWKSLQGLLGVAFHILGIGPTMDLATFTVVMKSLISTWAHVFEGSVRKGDEEEKTRERNSEILKRLEYEMEAVYRVLCMGVTLFV